MKLTKKTEAEVLQVYKTWWKSYLSGDVKTYDRYLDKEFRFVGSTDTEAFLNKRETTVFFRKTADQLSGKSVLRNSELHAEQFDGLVFITELADAYLLDGKKWIFYGKFRFTSVLRKTREGWRFIYQHYSVPDAKASEGETIGLEKVSRENQELRDAIKRRTVELEQKNRELEIETALEKVRAVAMSMKKREDMLEICKTISLQLARLGVKGIRNVQTAIFNVPRGTYMNYEFYARHKKTFITETEYTNHKVARAFAAKMLKGRGAVSITSIKGKNKVKEWLNYQKGTNVFIDTFLNRATSLTYYWYSLGPVALGISTYMPLTKEEQQLFCRFLNVFELSYRRYLDIEKAEEQAREAQIEASLERVRSAAMAMKHSAEIGNLIHHLYGELTKLDARLDRCFIMIVNPDNLGITWWLAGKEGLLNENGFFIQNNQHPSHQLYLNYWKKRTKKWQYLFEGKEKRDWDRFGFSKTELSKLPVPVKKDMAGIKKIYLSGSSDQFGCLVTGSMQPLSEEHQGIISRFATVFNQTYTRFLDLQKAEAQTRESQIEVALERVRARTMAMQRSDELPDTSYLLFQQLEALGARAEHFSIGIMNEAEEVGEMYATVKGDKLLQKRSISIHEPIAFKKVFTAWKKRKKNLELIISGPELAAYNKYRNKIIGRRLFPEKPAPGDRWIILCAYFSQGLLSFASSEPPSVEILPLLERFAGVFDATYTRFLDLQKAEAQTREAEIQLALERVRAKSLAMHHTSELQEVVNIAAQQLLGIGMDINGGIFICINAEVEKELPVWASGGAADYIQRAVVPVLNKPIFTRIRDAIRKGNDFLIETFSDLEKRELFTHLFKYDPWRSLTQERKEELLSRKGGFARSVVISRYTSISITNHQGKSFTKKENEILERFGKIFEQSYIRFLDLQKAESQTREAQIELGLERVRARAMAMQRSDELAELVDTVFKELTKLDMSLTWCMINIIHESSLSNTVWTVNAASGRIPESFNMKFEDYPFHHAMMKGWKERQTKYVYVLEGEEKKVYDEYLFHETEFRNVPAAAQAASRAMEKYVVTFSFSNFGGLQTVGDAPLAENSLDILSRFGKVFDLTYTRFNDLQLAESQARESQIQLALERVRARTMAMHRSEELSEVSAVLYKELQSLGVTHFINCGYIEIDEEENIQYAWMTVADGSGVNAVRLPLTGDRVFDERYEAWKRKEKIFHQTVGGDMLKSHIEFGTQHYRDTEIDELVRTSFADPTTFYCSNFSHGYLHIVTDTLLSEEVESLLTRFTGVFEMTYKRFLDLQKAEAQAREARIETALERTRTQSMIMQHSRELDDTLRVFHQQVLLLGIPSGFSFLWLPDEDKDRHVFWAVWEENDNGPVIKSKAINYPLDRNEPATAQCLVDWKGKEQVVSYQVPPDGVQGYFAAWSELLAGVDHLKPERFGDGLYYVEAFMKFGCFGVMLEKDLDDDGKKILSRFAVEFERTYTRFLDLQKAEAQAREAQIQLALERVRARTMAMQQSGELPEAANLLFHQVQSLGMPAWSAGYCIWDEDKKAITLSMSSEGVLQPSIRMPLTEDPSLIHFLEAHQRGETFYVEEVGGEALKRHYVYLRTLPGVKETLDDIEKAGFPVPTFQIFHCAYFSKGFLLFITYEPVPEAHDIFKRFGHVFEQTYTRFLDLQKAEAQAREAQIELSLERVRARTMAMHHSDELVDTCSVLFQELKTLGINAIRTGVAIIDDENESMELWSSQLMEQKQNKVLGVVNMKVHPFFEGLLNAWRRKDYNYTYEMKDDEVRLYYEKMASLISYPAQKKYHTCEVFNPFLFAEGSLTVVSHQHLTTEERDVMQRFARVFSLLYRRFLDLQKAEAQAREAQIEAALERVRSRTMGMQKSEELKEVIRVVYEQFVHLNILVEHAGFIMDYKERDDLHIWLADQHLAPSEVTIPAFDSPPNNSIKAAKEKGQDSFAYLLAFEEKNKFYRDLFMYIPGVPEETLNYYLSCPGLAGSGVLLDNVGLYIENFSGTLYTDEENAVLMRFGKVFQQTYTRFLDLQKAESQAREAEIELGLERVRARAMAMQSSDELSTLIGTVFTELTKLDLALTRCIIWVFEPATNATKWWMANSEEPSNPMSFYIKYHEHPAYLTFVREWKNQNVKFVYDLKGQDKINWDEILFNETELANLPDVVKNGMKAPERVLLSASFNNFGGINVASLESLSDEHFDILLRFAKVFDLTYTRFLDLKNAEAQAREAQIEAALERVRAKVMAMKVAADLSETSLVFGKQLRDLGIDWQFAYFWLIEGDKDENTFWITWPDNKTSTTTYSWAEADESFRECLVAWRAQTRIHATHVPKEDVPAWLQTFERITYDAGGVSKKIMTPGNFREGVYYYDAMIRYGSFGILTNRVTNEEEQAIQCRFAVEFERAYTRFLDLQKAEAQAKEAQIEAAMERIRARAMAMHTSGELMDVANVLRGQMGLLNQPDLETSAVLIYHEDGESWDSWYAFRPTRDDTGHIRNGTAKFSKDDCALTREIVQYFRSPVTDYTLEISGAKREEWLAVLMKAAPEVAENAINDETVNYDTTYFHFSDFQGGSLLTVSYLPPSEEIQSLQRRAALVFELAYRRFLDLRKAEAQTREARIEAALERVRSRAMAMQEPEELKDVTQVLRTEMGLLGVEELETCSIYINDEHAGKSECWYALKDIRSANKELVSDHFALDLNETWVGREMLQFYHSAGNRVSIVMKGTNRKEWIHYCEEKSALLRGYYGEVIPDRTYHLYKFSHGAIGAASAAAISEESWGLLKRAASVFSLAYSRFKDLTQARIDLQRLKEEKQRAETALTELQATQKQLVQSEKMASLGELTAGIAHEIQNPLNFVNNFSEVSKELLDEMKEAIEKGDTEDAKEIMNDVIQNLEKINQHGKRADGIVKGMLQHSRSSSGQKEMTDINAICDEYIRLAYHGLRAKDKSFNAKFETNLDTSIGKINIMPQEIGRVILNLINNAFYAVTERKKTAGAGYDPTVTVSTKRMADKVEIVVKDNGSGIPQRILDKIFQPFFTTKPSGQGTGLGLSLSYDIITKGHGGELKVETKEGEGTSFIIVLP